MTLLAQLNVSVDADEVSVSCAAAMRVCCADDKVCLSYTEWE